MSSILDIDLDYFRFFDDPVEELDRLLTWADRPIDFVVEHHDEAFERWVSAVKRRATGAPRFILHADEHHDMLSDRRPIGFGNFLYFAMRRWPNCRVHWLVNGPIDHPDMWLSERVWKSIADRFTLGSRPPRAWPKPDFVSVCTSPDFIDKGLRRKLIRRLHTNTPTQTKVGVAVQSGRTREDPMAETIRRVDYFYVTAPNKPGEGVRMLSTLKEAGINLLAFSGFPSGRRSQIDFVPEDPAAFRKVAGKAGWKLSPRKTGFLIEGEEQVGALLNVVSRLADAKINVTAVDAVCAGQGRYGALLWVKAPDVRKAAKALGIR